MARLIWGDPPTYDECADIGESRAPIDLVLPDDPALQRIEKVDDRLYGQPLPDRVRVRHVLHRLRERIERGPIRTRIPGVGTLLAGTEGWEVVE